MQNGKVSIIITNYNYENFIRRSIDSALNQTYKDIEVIVVDDCSKDDSVNIIKSYADRIIAILKSQNEGHGAGMNSGFSASSGALILLLDADDYLYPDAVSSILARRQDGAAQYQYRMDLVDAQGAAFDQYPPEEAVMDEGDVVEKLLRQGRYATTVTSGLAFDRAVLEKVMPMPAESFRQGGDGYLVTVAPLYGAVVTVPGRLSAYCQHGSNHSQFDQALAKRARWRLWHDERRYDALREHARRLSLSLAEDPGLWDLVHLEQRITALRLEPGQHPYPGDTPASIARLALAALRASDAPAKRRLLLRLWWLAAGHGPAPLAKAAIAWKLAASSRPEAVDRLLKLARRFTKR